MEYGNVISIWLTCMVYSHVAFVFCSMYRLDMSDTTNFSLNPFGLYMFSFTVSCGVDSKRGKQLFQDVMQKQLDHWH
jgi:hypothetical protein